MHSFYSHNGFIWFDFCPLLREKNEEKKEWNIPLGISCNRLAISHSNPFSLDLFFFAFLPFLFWAILKPFIVYVCSHFFLFFGGEGGRLPANARGLFPKFILSFKVKIIFLAFLTLNCFWNSECVGRIKVGHSLHRVFVGLLGSECHFFICIKARLKPMTCCSM